MQQLLHIIAREFQVFKQNPKTSEINFPTINGNINLEGFNTFLATLWASNRNLNGNYSTFSFIKENDLKIKEKAPKITFLDYYWTGTMLFIAQDVKKYMPNFDISDENIHVLKKLFQEGKINSFPTRGKEEIEKDFGEIYEINFQENILNYLKVEAIPNEFIIGLEQEKSKEELSQEKKRIKEKVEKEWYDNFDEALQYFYFLLNAFGKANMEMLKHFELYELNLDADFLVRIDNNFVLSKQITLNLFNQIKQV